MSLKDKRVLITGGTAGLGAAIALKFAEQGAHLAINYATSTDRATALQKEISARWPASRVVLLRGDVSRGSVCRDLVEGTVAALGGIDCVVSNAGWTKFSDWSDLDAFSEDEWDRVWAVNVKAHLFLFKAAKPYFLANAREAEGETERGGEEGRGTSTGVRGGGSMIITTSVAGIKQAGSALAYSVSKHAAIALARGLALHQGPHCRINTVAPGLIATDWAVNQFGEARMRAIEQSGPLKRNASLEDCADAFVLLASNASITGQTIVLDGGQSLK